MHEIQPLIFKRRPRSTAQRNKILGKCVLSNGRNYGREGSAGAFFENLKPVGNGDDVRLVSLSAPQEGE